MPHNGTGYYVVMTDNNTKTSNNGSHSDGRQVLNNTRLNHIYHNKGLKSMNSYLLILKVKIWQKMLFPLVSMTAILNFELTKSHRGFFVSLLDSSSLKTP